MQHDRATGGRLGVELRQHRGDVLIRQAVKSISSHAGVVQLLGKCESLRNLGIRAVERRIEAGDLRQLRRALEQPTDWREVVRLMQRRERNQLFKRRHRASINDHGLRVVQPAMHDPMADADEWHSCELGAQKRDQVVERAVMAELRALGPRLLRRDRSVAPLGDKVGCSVNPFDLAANGELQLAAAREKERELDARRAGVQNADCVSHSAALT